MAERSVLSTHVLNAAQGVPTEGVSVELRRLGPGGGDGELVCRTSTGPDGRADAALLPPDGFASGTYELRFGLGAYFRGRGLAADPAFLDVVPVRINLADARGHHHVPLLCSPWSYTAYRGS